MVVSARLRRLVTPLVDQIVYASTAYTDLKSTLNQQSGEPDRLLPAAWRRCRRPLARGRAAAPPVGGARPGPGPRRGLARRRLPHGARHRQLHEPRSRWGSVRTSRGTSTSVAGGSGSRCSTRPFAGCRRRCRTEPSTESGSRELERDAAVPAASRARGVGRLRPRAGHAAQDRCRGRRVGGDLLAATGRADAVPAGRGRAARLLAADRPGERPDRSAGTPAADPDPPADPRPREQLQPAAAVRRRLVPGRGRGELLCAGTWRPGLDPQRGCDHRSTSGRTPGWRRSTSRGSWGSRSTSGSPAPALPAEIHRWPRRC